MFACEHLLRNGPSRSDAPTGCGQREPMRRAAHCSNWLATGSPPAPEPLILAGIGYNLKVVHLATGCAPAAGISCQWRRPRTLLPPARPARHLAPATGFIGLIVLIDRSRLLRPIVVRTAPAHRSWAPLAARAPTGWAWRRRAAGERMGFAPASASLVRRADSSIGMQQRRTTG